MACLPACLAEHGLEPSLLSRKQAGSMPSALGGRMAANGRDLQTRRDMVGAGGGHGEVVAGEGQVQAGHSYHGLSESTEGRVGGPVVMRCGD